MLEKVVAFLLSLFEEMKRYCLVKFPNEKNEIAVINIRWIDGDFCLWPPAKDRKSLRNLVEKGAILTENWKKVKCDVIASFGKYLPTEISCQRCRRYLS